MLEVSLFNVSIKCLHLISLLVLTLAFRNIALMNKRIKCPPLLNKTCLPLTSSLVDFYDAPHELGFLASVGTYSTFPFQIGNRKHKLLHRLLSNWLIYSAEEQIVHSFHSRQIYLDASEC